MKIPLPMRPERIALGSAQLTNTALSSSRCLLHKEILGGCTYQYWLPLFCLKIISKLSNALSKLFAHVPASCL